MDVVEANTGILPVDDRINRIQDLSSDRIVIQESGYLKVYVNNAAQTPVYYDNLVVMQSTGNVIEVNAYYPYGKIIQGLSTSSTYGKNNYKYNGKELQTELELGWLDYGARMLDGPRWFVPDPLAEKYYSWSPYVYALNNPVRFIDPFRMAADDYYNEAGEYLYTDNKTSDNIKIIKQEDWDNIAATNSEAISDRSHSYASLDQALDEKSVGMEDTRLSAEAYSNIFTNALSRMDEVDVTKLFNGKVSVAVGKWRNNLSDFYNEPEWGNQIASYSPWNGKMRVTVIIRATGDDVDTRSDYATISNVKSVLGVHEYLGHGIIGWDGSNEGELNTYDFQMKHKTWKKTTPTFQERTKESANLYK